MAKKTLRRPTKNVLLSWGVLKKVNDRIVPTVAYALLTGQLQDQPYIQCAIFKGDTRANFLDHRDIHGPVQDQLDGAILYVMEKLNRAIQIRGMYGVDRYELPIDSVRELIANAIAHRSYLNPGLIQIALYDNRLEITSPGMLLSGVTLESMKEGLSQIRNKALAKAFTYMHIIEQWGSGIPRFLAECKAYGLPPPQLIDFERNFRINVFRNPNPQKANQKANQSSAQKLSKKGLKVLETLKKNPNFSQTDLANKLGWSISVVKYHVLRLRKSQYLEHIGSLKAGTWKINL